MLPCGFEMHVPKDRHHLESTGPVRLHDFAKCLGHQFLSCLSQGSDSPSVVRNGILFVNMTSTGMIKFAGRTQSLLSEENSFSPFSHFTSILGSILKSILEENLLSKRAQKRTQKRTSSKLHRETFMALKFSSTMNPILTIPTPETNPSRWRLTTGCIGNGLRGLICKNSSFLTQNGISQIQKSNLKIFCRVHQISKQCCRRQ